ncbi:MAG TPA: hypothetical protein VM452_16150, partial [Caulifigura sp.]|nr:hypothetical protein [Caulifigura sp.]
TVRIRVEVNRPGVWHDVPLRLGQASIYRQKSSGVGSRVPGLPALQEDGLHWRFFGQGEHTLEFELGVPVRTMATGKQLQLSLPTMPPLFEARLNLRIPGGDYLVRSVNRDATFKVGYSKESNETAVEGGIPGGRIDISWQGREQGPQADAVASSVITISRRGPNVELDAVQTLLRMEARSNECLVRLPTGFVSGGVTGALIESAVQLPDQPNVFRLTFLEGTSDRIDLRWKLSRPLPAAGEPLELDGFQIDGVRTHDGRLRIMPFPGYELFPQAASMRYVERADDATTPGETPPQLAYLFSAAGWRLAVELRPIEPLFACRTKLDLLVQDRMASLTAAFQLQEEAGEVPRLAVDVAALEAAGWAPASGSRPPSAGAPMVRDGSTAVFEWSQSGGGPKVAELHFERPLSGSEFDFLVPPPVPRATWKELPIITVRAADQLRIGVESATSDDRPAESVASESSRLIGVYRPAIADRPIEVHGTVEARTISATANVLVESVESRRVTVEQQIVLDVRYGRLDSLRLLIPEGFPVTPGAERLAFQVWVDGREATDLEWTSGALRVPFVRPRIGLIRVSVRYALPRSPDASRLQLPVVLTPDVKFHEVTMEAAPATRLSVAPSSTQWKEIVTASDRRRWSADPQAASIDLLFEKERTAVVERAVIAAALIRSEVAAGGLHRTVAEYDVERSGELLTVTLPRSATPYEMTVNGQAAEIVRPGDGVENQWTLRMPANPASGSTRLQISYDVAGSPRGAIARMKFAFPEFPAGTYINQLIWRLTLPDGDVLLSSPAGVTRLFEWQRRGLMWRRVLSPGYAAALQSAGFEEPGGSGPLDGYAFRQLGGSPSLQVWMIDRSLVILFGAGVTLILGFAFWTIRRLQNIVVLLLLAFLISVAGLWFPEAIQVLLQPALFGVAMAMAATAVDGRSRRRRFRPPARESSVQPVIRPRPAKVNDPLRSTILRPTAGSDQGVPR